MKCAQLLFPILMVACCLEYGIAQTPAPAEPSPTPAPVQVSQESKQSPPFPIDLSPYFTRAFVEPDGHDSRFVGYSGHKIVDGLPFNVDGECLLWGKSNAMRNKVYPEQVTGIKIDRAFEELHLLHCVEWREYSGCPVATIRLNYTDGSHHDFSIRYNEHVLDWARLITEEQEIVSDPGTKIILRNSGPFSSSSRLFDTVLHNPFPALKVESMDLISTKSAASYVLLAATVSDKDPTREVTQALPKVPSRNFNGRFRIHVIDHKTGAPLAGVEVYPYMTIDDYGLVADPLLTGADGTVTIKYPTAHTAEVGVSVEKSGYRSMGKDSKKGSIPFDMTLEMISSGSFDVGYQRDF